MPIKIVCISDSHTKHSKVVIPNCDILIHAGDWSFEGTAEETRSFAKWLDSLENAGDIILTPGNHERVFQREMPESLAWIKDECPRVNLLIHEAVEVQGINFFGSPNTPAFGFQWAWNCGRTPVEAAHLFKPFIGDLWAQIPESTQILVTHGMPYGILDDALDYYLGKITSVGDKELLKRCKELPNLRHVIGGHLHSNGGKSLHQDGIWYHNTSVVNESYQVVNLPIIIEI